MVGAVTNREFELFRDLILERAGIQLKESKRLLVANRLRRRMDAFGLSCHRRYYDLLIHDPNGRNEMQEFINALTTNETYFFRHPEQFQHLTDILIPDIVGRREAGSKSPLRIWSAACASGEEPYSIAIQIRESGSPSDDRPVEIIGSDINLAMIHKANAAVYGAYATGKIKAVLRDRYFIREQGADIYHLAQGIRRGVRFFHGNLLDPFPHGPFDVIFCRNVLIYFGRGAKDRVMANLNRSLAPGGYLVTGYAESLMNTDHPFRYVKPTVYQKL